MECGSDPQTRLVQMEKFPSNLEEILKKGSRYSQAIGGTRCHLDPKLELSSIGSRSVLALLKNFTFRPPFLGVRFCQWDKAAGYS